MALIPILSTKDNQNIEWIKAKMKSQTNVKVISTDLFNQIDNNYLLCWACVCVDVKIAAHPAGFVFTVSRRR